MATWRTTFFLSSSKQGWTETFFSQLAARADVFAAARNYRTLRMRCALPDVQMDAIRVSDDLVFRDAQYDPTLDYPYVGTSTEATGSLPPRVVLLLRLETPPPGPLAVSLSRRIFPLHGLPKAVVTGGVYTPTATFTATLTTFLTFLTSALNDFALRVETNATPFAAVSGIDAGGIVTLPTPIVIPGGGAAYLQFRSLRGVIPPANRPFLIRSADLLTPQHIQLNSWRRPAVVGPVGVTAKAFQYGLSLIGQALPDVLSTRKTGRVFGGLRGRRSPQR